MLCESARVCRIFVVNTLVNTSCLKADILDAVRTIHTTICVFFFSYIVLCNEISRILCDTLCEIYFCTIKQSWTRYSKKKKKEKRN